MVRWWWGWSVPAYAISCTCFHGGGGLKRSRARVCATQRFCAPLRAPSGLLGAVRKSILGLCFSAAASTPGTSTEKSARRGTSTTCVGD